MPHPMVVKSAKSTPGVSGRYRMIVHAIESPNTATRTSPGARWRTGWVTATGTSGATSAAESISGPGPGLGNGTPEGSTVIATTAAVAAVAADSRSIGTNVGRQSRIGCSISHHDTAAIATVAAQ